MVGIECWGRGSRVGRLTRWSYFGMRHIKPSPRVHTPKTRDKTSIQKKKVTSNHAMKQSDP